MTDSITCMRGPILDVESGSGGRLTNSSSSFLMEFEGVLHASGKVRGRKFSIKLKELYTEESPLRRYKRDGREGN